MDRASIGRSVWLERARRGLVNVFLVVHLGATCLWVMPACPLRERCFPLICYYILPLGLWQYWGMFAPDPVRDTYTLEAEAIDARGLRHGLAFSKLADFSLLAGIPRFRHSKFAANLAIPELDANRKMAAHHAVRQLAIPDEAYPVEVRLIFQVRPTPPPGSDPDEAPRVAYGHLLAKVTIADAKEVRP